MHKQLKNWHQLLIYVLHEASDACIAFGVLYLTTVQPSCTDLCTTAAPACPLRPVSSMSTHDIMDTQ